MREHTRREVLVGGGIAALAGLSGCSGLTPFVGKRIEENRTIDPRDVDRMAIAVDAGDVTVEAADVAAIEVESVKKSSAVGVDLSNLYLRTTRSNGRVRLRSDWTGGDVLFGSRPQLDISARVPRSIGVERVESDVGDVSVTGTGGDFVAHSNVGDVTVRAVEGDVELRSDVGDAVATDVAGTVTAHTSTGDVEVSGVTTVGELRAKTGDVEVDVAAIDGTTPITTVTGDVTVRVAPDLDADLHVRAGVGDLSYSGLPLAGSERTGTVTGSTLRGTLGDGGPELRIEAETGDVTVQSLE